MIKQFCDICKVELEDNMWSDNTFKISLPTKNYNVCSECLKEVTEYLENKMNSYKLENKRYEINCYNKKWEEIC